MTICAWCQHVIDNAPSALTSHGICKECSKTFREEARLDCDLEEGLRQMEDECRREFMEEAVNEVLEGPANEQRE